MKPTQEQVIAWAREARFYESEIADDIQWFTILATLAYEAGRKDENEACAQIAAYLLKLPENDISAMIRRRIEQ